MDYIEKMRIVEKREMPVHLGPLSFIGAYAKKIKLFIKLFILVNFLLQLSLFAHVPFITLNVNFFSSLSTKYTITGCYILYFRE